MRNGVFCLMGTLAAVLIIGGMVPQPAEAQGPRLTRPRLAPFQRPTTSPYLNLLDRGGLGLGFEYHRRVRPELEFRRAHVEQFDAMRNLQRQTQMQQRQLQDVQRQIGPTGHGASFLNYGNYYQFGR